MTMIDDVISVDPLDKNIAVRLSGGPDSSIIYYALCNFFKDYTDVNIYPYTLNTALRPHSVNKAKGVIELVGKLTGKYPAKHYESCNLNHRIDNSVESNSQEYTIGQDNLEHEVIENHSIDSNYTGLSINCPIDELQAMVESDNFKYDKVECKKWLSERDVNRTYPLYSTVGKLGNVTYYMPFARSDKRTVFKLYNYYNLLEDLYPITWSCENHMQMYTDTPTHCGVCYFCLERLYAFGKL